MTVLLHQILAVEKGTRSSTEGVVTRAYHDAQRGDMFRGLTRVYAALNEDDREIQPSERKTVQRRADDLLRQVADAWTRQSDLVATKDSTNQTTRADVIVGGVTVMTAVPVQTLLYLEKLLVNVRTLVAALPVLDPEVQWGQTPNPTTGLWTSETEQTIRTRKVPKAFVKAPATEKHAAQVDTFTEDVQVGTWTRTLLSGALSASRRGVLLHRVEMLSAAVKMAREYANRVEIVEKKIGEDMFSFLLAP